jgi:hypothetical protein
MNADAGPNEVTFSIDELAKAAEQGVIEPASVARLLAWRESRAPASATSMPERPKGLNFVTIAYYFGAMLMISACAWFLGDKWDALGSAGILATTLIYFIVATGLGVWLRQAGYFVGGGLLVTVAVSLVPLIAYSIEDLLGLWPSLPPGPYMDYYPLIRGSWIVMELATMMVAAGALYWVRFGFLTAPLAFSAWFFSMDVWALLRDKNVLAAEDRQLVSVYVGLATLVLGYALDSRWRRHGGTKSDDFAFWCYLFGLLAFWGGLTSMHSDSEVSKALYGALNVGLIGVGVWLRRATFVAFGALGVHVYLGHLAYEVFKDSFLFPFTLAFLGLSMILCTVAGQRLMARAGAATA